MDGVGTRGPVPLQRLRILVALIVRETGTKFGRSYGGYLWAIAEPLGGIVLLTLAFSLALRKPPLGSNFALFYATGVVPFMVFNNVARSVAAAVDSNRGLLRYPVVTTLDAVLAKFVLDFLTMFVVAVLLYSGLILAYGLDVNLDPAAAARRTRPGLALRGAGPRTKAGCRFGSTPAISGPSGPWPPRPACDPVSSSRSGSPSASTRSAGARRLRPTSGRCSNR